MKSNELLMTASCLKMVVATLFVALGVAGASRSNASGTLCSNGPVKVDIRTNSGCFRLYVDNKPFYIKGAGIELGSPEKLRYIG